MNKIRNYNQILLAIAGTIAIAFIVISSLVFISEIMPREYEEEGMIANEEVEILANGNVRKEIVSFGEPELVDSANRCFIIPVITTDLENPESTDKTLGLMNNFSGGYGRDLATNNLIIYNEKVDTSKIVFKRRLRINEYVTKEYEGETYIVIRGCEEDTNKDRYLNTRDLQKLYLYELSKNKVSEIRIPENYSSYRLYERTFLNDWICRFGVDRNGDGRFDKEEEPTVLMNIDPKKSKTNNIISEEQIGKLQNTLDGN